MPKPENEIVDVFFVSCRLIRVAWRSKFMKGTVRFKA